ncbi:MAG TPA: hypothetical protein VHC22_23835 [Pirellulales bacterium]|nr:hypothetical protein [Pirellulales bacterium]
MIHCDEVFDILTRGPFPTGAPSDGIVESHLNHCDTCRQLAEALRPAIELLQESIAPEESDGLPRYGGSSLTRSSWSDREPSPLSTKAVARPAARVALRLRLREQTVAWRWRSAAKVAAAACVGLVLAGMLRQMVVPRTLLPGTTTPVAVAAQWRQGVDALEWAAEQGLRDDCLQIDNGLAVLAAPARKATGGAVQLACCLSCHGAKQQRLVPAARVPDFKQACQACH